MKCNVVGIDLAKSGFQVCQLDQSQQVLSNRKVARSKLLDVLRQLPAHSCVAMEACGSAHYWARQIQALGLSVRLLPPQHVKAFVGHQKNDANDARAIAEASQRPGLHCVPVKTLEQQDIKVLRCQRERWVNARTALSNQLRGLLAEYGVVLPRSLSRLRSELPSLIGEPPTGVTEMMRRCLIDGYEELRELDRRIRDAERQLHQLCQQQPDYTRLLEIPGIGPLNGAAVLSQIGDGSQFTTGREFAAWCGLVPRQHSSGARQVLGGITKNGNREIRTLLIHGARSVVYRVKNKDTAMGRWLQRLLARRGTHKTVVALANKLARIVWAVLHSGQAFDMRRAFA